MNDIVRMVSELVESCSYMERENERIKATYVDADRFRNVPLPLDTVGAMHGVSSKVVRRLVSVGLIPKHPMSTDAKILVRASDALTLDIDMLRAKARNRIKSY